MHTVKEMWKKYLTPLVFTFAIVFANDDSTNCIRSSGDLRESLVVNLLNNAENLIKSAKKYSLVESTCLKNTGFCEKPADCAEVLENDRKSKNGIFKIWPRSRVIGTSIDVYCDMEDDSGAWTVIQRRGNFDSAKDYFFQDWAAYKKGFGDLQKDFWLGNDNIYALTNQRTYTVKFDLVDWDNTKVYAAYDEFYIDDEDHNYMSHVKGYRGNAVTSDNCHSVTLKDATTCSNSSTVKILLENAQKLIEDAKKYSSAEESCYPNERFCKKPVDCAEILDKNRQSKSGIYKIWPRSRIMDNTLEVYCDMNDDGGAWTVIQRRGNFDSAKDYFFQDWASYKKGFGDLEKDFWLGNDNIYALTNQRMYSLKFDLVDWNNTRVYASFDEFYIDDEDHNYTSHVKSYRGNAGDSFSFTNGIPFSTKDKDNDKHADSSCAVRYKGAWWYTSCHTSNLNGLYLKGSHESFADGVNWHAFRGHNHSLKDTVIKIRPKHFMKTVLDPTPQ